jgi:hypothetical protein
MITMVSFAFLLLIASTPLFCFFLTSASGQAAELLLKPYYSSSMEAALAASICLSINKLQAGTDVSEADKVHDFSAAVTLAQKTGLRMTMTVIPIVGLIIAFIWFKKRFILDEAKVAEITEAVKAKRENEVAETAE